MYWTCYDRDTYSILITYSHLNGSSILEHWTQSIPSMPLFYISAPIYEKQVWYFTSHFDMWCENIKNRCHPKKSVYLNLSTFPLQSYFTKFHKFLSLSLSLSQRNWEISSYHPLYSHYSLYLMTIWSECMLILLTIFSVSVYFRDPEDRTHAQVAFSVSLCPSCLGGLIL